VGEQDNYGSRLVKLADVTETFKMSEQRMHEIRTMTRDHDPHDPHVIHPHFLSLF